MYLLFLKWAIYVEEEWALKVNIDIKRGHRSQNFLSFMPKDQC